MQEAEELSSATGVSTGPAPSPASAALRGYLLEQVDDLRLAVADDDVHDARVACRRIRSALLEHLPSGPAEQRDEARRIAHTARGLGQAMSSARDAEVVGEVVRGWAADDGWSREQLADALHLLRADTEPDPAVDALDDDLLGLATQVAAYAGAPGWETAPTADDLRAGHGRAHGRLRARARRAGASGESPGTGATWHDVRKAAKRLRYVAEVAQNAGDAAAGEVVESARWLQRVLGDLQDLEIVRVRLAHAGGDLPLERRLALAQAGLEADLPSALADVVGGSGGAPSESEEPT
jgi:CHAD domain-containing protein